MLIIVKIANIVNLICVSIWCVWNPYIISFSLHSGWRYHPGFGDDKILRIQGQVTKKGELGLTHIMSAEPGPFSSVLNHRILETQVWDRLLPQGVNTNWSMFYNILHQLENTSLKNLFSEVPLCAKLCTKQGDTCKLEVIHKPHLHRNLWSYGGQRYVRG